MLTNIRRAGNFKICTYIKRIPKCYQQNSSNVTQSVKYWGSSLIFLCYKIMKHKKCQNHIKSLGGNKEWNVFWTSLWAHSCVMYFTCVILFSQLLYKVYIRTPIFFEWENQVLGEVNKLLMSQNWYRLAQK
jgi:hypothetical protein